MFCLYSDKQWVNYAYFRNGSNHFMTKFCTEKAKVDRKRNCEGHLLPFIHHSFVAVFGGSRKSCVAKFLLKISLNNCPFTQNKIIFNTQFSENQSRQQLALVGRRLAIYSSIATAEVINVVAQNLHSSTIVKLFVTRLLKHQMQIQTGSLCLLIFWHYPPPFNRVKDILWI